MDDDPNRMALLAGAGVLFLYLLFCGVMIWWHLAGRDRAKLAFWRGRAWLAAFGAAAFVLFFAFGYS